MRKMVWLVWGEMFAVVQTYNNEEDGVAGVGGDVHCCSDLQQ
jgi:hypothetical protein